MRFAAAAKAWERVYGREYPTRLTKLSFQDFRELGTDALSFEGGITALCGANGVGKTTLLRLTRLLTSEELVGPGVLAAPAQAEAAIVSGHREFKCGAANSRVTQPLPPDADLNVEWLDVASLAPRMIKLLESAGDIEVLKEPVEPAKSDAEALEEIGYVVGRAYESVLTYELDLGEEEEVPYFVVESSGRQYNSAQMGLGELSAHVLVWALRRAPAKSLVLVEEPESYLAPRSQEALLNVLAKYSNARSLWVVLSTHSEAILRRVPPEHIRLLSRVGGKVKVTTPKSRSEYLGQLGIPPRFFGVVLVEDHVGELLAKEFLGRFAPHVLLDVAIAPVPTGESGVIQALRFPRAAAGWLRIIGLLDGDQRAAAHKDVEWPYWYLPGTQPAELVFQGLAAKFGALLAEKLGRDEAMLLQAMARLEGVDPHDWFTGLARYLAVGHQQLVAAFFGIWMADADEEAKAKEDSRIFCEAMYSPFSQAECEEFRRLVKEEKEATGPAGQPSVALPGTVTERLRQLRSRIVGWRGGPPA